MSGPLLSLRGVSLDYRLRGAFFSHQSRRALDAVTLEVQPGETLGVIGGNGSGKSTLLRLLAGIFTPHEGTVVRNTDRVMLLSLALGFEPELSGRENALLSGVLLGGRRRFVESRLEEIIAFAELGEQIDEPLKTYSNGMRARLGFAVALMMEADLTLIDEIFGVGDADFQRKARAAMQDRFNTDGTFVFVSHSLETVRSLCDRVVWLQLGRIMDVGDPATVIAAYRDSGAEQRTRSLTL